MERIFKLFILVAVLALGLSGSSLLAATKSFVGVDYGPFHKDGQAPGTPIPDSQFLADLGLWPKDSSLSEPTPWIRNPAWTI